MQLATVQEMNPVGVDPILPSGKKTRSSLTGLTRQCINRGFGL